MNLGKIVCTVITGLTLLAFAERVNAELGAVSYTHLTLPTKA